MPSVLFVCLGNICRSPAAEGMLRHLASKDPQFKDLTIKSCGLGSWHQGQLPDIRMQDAARRRGIVLSSRAQAFQHDFFSKFDYILIADHDVMNVLYQQAKSPEHKAKLQLITAYSNSYKGEEIPDPFYCDDAVFERVLEMLEESCLGLLEHIKRSHSTDS